MTSWPDSKKYLAGTPSAMFEAFGSFANMAIIWHDIIEKNLPTVVKRILVFDFLSMVCLNYLRCNSNGVCKWNILLRRAITASSRSLKTIPSPFTTSFFHSQVVAFPQDHILWRLLTGLPSFGLSDVFGCSAWESVLSGFELLLDKGTWIAISAVLYWGLTQGCKRRAFLSSRLAQKPESLICEVSVRG